MVKKILNTLNPKVPKRILLFIAGLVWSVAGYRVMLVLSKDLPAVINIIRMLILGFLGYIVFFQMVFHKVLLKHTKRIIRHEQNKLCVFSFFDFKSYLIMAFMVGLGIVSVKFIDLPKNIMAGFFMSLSLSLLTAAIYFFYYGIRFNYAKKKFAKSV